MKARLALLVTLALLAAGCGGAGSSTAGGGEGTSSQFAGTELASSPRAPDFALRDQAGRLVRLSAERGRLVLVTFLYTHCPDVCPLIAANLNAALRELGPDRRRVRVLAVSTDPERDTPAAVRSYARNRRLLPQFHYLIGARPRLERIWAAYNVVVFPGELEKVDHSDITMLVDRSGRGRVLYRAETRPSAIVHDLRLLLRDA